MPICRRTRDCFASSRSSRSARCTSIRKRTAITWPATPHELLAQLRACAAPRPTSRRWATRSCSSTRSTACRPARSRSNSASSSRRRSSRCPLGQWQGPVESGYGVHLVFISERTEGRLADVGGRARRRASRVGERARDWTALRSFYQELLKRYTVTIESLEPRRGAEATGRGEVKTAILLADAARPCRVSGVGPRGAPRVSRTAPDRAGHVRRAVEGSGPRRQPAPRTSTWSFRRAARNVTEPRASMVNNAYTERWTREVRGRTDRRHDSHRRPVAGR